MGIYLVVQRVLVYATVAVVGILYALALAGCVSTSPGIPNIFLAQISNGASATQSSIQIRVGYFGMCISQGQGLSCANTYGSSPAAVASSLFVGQNGTTHAAETQALIGFGLLLQNKIIVPLLAFGGLLFFFGIFGFLSLQFFSKRGSSSTKLISWIGVIAIILLWTSSALTSAAIASTTMAIAGMDVTTQQMNAAALGVSPGTTLQVLQWALLVCSLLFTLGTTVVLWRGVRTLASAKSSTGGSQSKFEPMNAV